jgi:hypothetical protein
MTYIHTFVALALEEQWCHYICAIRHEHNRRVNWKIENTEDWILNEIIRFLHTRLLRESSYYVYVFLLEIDFHNLRFSAVSLELTN